MKITNLTLAAGVLSITAAIFSLPVTAQAQSYPSSDTFQVTLIHPVCVNGKILQPGNYNMEPLNIAGGDSPVLVIRGDNDTRIELSAMTFPTYVTRPQTETRVILHHIGGKYYFDRIWVKGQNFGYAFKLPKNVVARAGEQ
jgi:hypothetical protein